MERKSILLLGLIDVGGSIALAGCSPADDSSNGASSESPSSSSSSYSSIPTPVTGETMSYLKGSFYGGGGTLLADEKKVVYEGDANLNLVPTSVGKITLTSEDEDGVTTKQKAVVVYLSDSSSGEAYRLYADTLNDGFVHLEKQEGEEYSKVASFQPDVSKYAGAYSAYGRDNEEHGSEYNFYFVLDPNFDTGRDAYPLGYCYPAHSSFSSEQNWYYLARIRLGIFNKGYYSVECYDSDGYGYGEWACVTADSGYTLDGGGYDVYYPDEGAYNNLELFEEGRDEAITTALSAEDRTITFGEKSGTYQIAYDEKGMYLEANFESEEAKLRLGDLYLTYESGDKTSVYPIDTISDLYGTFTDKVNTFSYDYDWETWDYALKFNDKTIEEYSFVTENNRKSFSFDVDGVNYVVSPDKSDVAVRVKKGDEVSYYINATRYDDLFVDTFVAHDANNSFSFSVDSGFAYAFDKESGETYYSYSHGDRYPSLVLKGSSGNKKLTPVFESAGYFLLKEDDKEDVTIYSETVLDKVYETYSSNGKDTLVISKDKLTYEGKDYDYEFAPYYQEGTAYYFFGIDSEIGSFVSNLSGWVLGEDDSFVTKSTFASIAGTYSLYSKYGIENIKMSATGDLSLDTTNKAGDGLDKDVPYDYYIYITEDTSNNIIPVVAFKYGGTNVLIYFYGDHLMIVGLDYYRYGILQSWGAYLDSDGSNILSINGGSLYLNGDELSITSMSESDGKTVYETDSGTLTVSYTSTGATASLVSEEGTTSFSRAYSFSDYDKFVGEYEVNNTTLKFAKAGGSAETYTATIGEGLFATSVDVNDMKFVLKDGNVTLAISPSGGTYYYLSIDASGTVTASYESSIPTPPPAPPLP